MKLKYIGLFIIILVLPFSACSKKETPIYEYGIKKHELREEVVAQRIFKENTNVFYELQKYYASVNYEAVLLNVEDNQILETGGVEYLIGVTEDDYIMSYFDYMDQKGKENLPASVSEIRTLIKNYNGFVLQIDKETYELVNIEINISNDLEGILLCIIWGKTEKDLEDCHIFFDDHWGMVVMYYDGM